MHTVPDHEFYQDGLDATKMVLARMGEGFTPPHEIVIDIVVNHIAALEHLLTLIKTPGHREPSRN